MAKYYGHHPSADIVNADEYYKKTQTYDRTEVETYADAASASAVIAAHNHYDGLWDDVRVPANIFNIAGPQEPDNEQWVSSTLYTLAFDPDTLEQVFFNVQLPHGYKLGTDLYPHIHWGTVEPSAGDVVWGLEYTIAKRGDVFPSSTTLSVTAAAPQVAYKHVSDEFGVIDGSAIDTISAMIVGRVFRDATNGNDTFPEDAALLELDFHIQFNELGSVQEYSKY